MSLDTVPDEILEEIFKKLDGDALWTALKFSERWFSIIVSSKSLMSNLRVEVTEENYEEIKAMNLPIRNLSLKGFRVTEGYFRDFRPRTVETVDDYTSFILDLSQSLESIKLDGMSFPTFSTIFVLISNLKTLKSISIDNCSFKHESIAARLPEGSSSNLRETYLKIFRDPLILEHLNNIKTLEKFEFICHQNDNGISRRYLPQLLEKVPSIKHLSLDGEVTSAFFKSDSFPFKLDRLDLCIFGSNYSHSEEPRLAFLQSQQESLKHLRLLKLPYDYDGGVVLKFIIEEMNLDTFCYRETPLIVNGRKCKDVEKFWFNEVQIKAGMEMMRQFPSIKNLEVLLAKTRIDKSQAKSLLYPQTDIFLNVEELKVTDHSGHCDLVPCFLGLYKNCRNVKKFIINSYSTDLNEILGDVLPHLTQLEELHFTVRINEITKGIIEKNMKVESISVYFKEELCEILKRYERGSLVKSLKNLLNMVKK